MKFTKTVNKEPNPAFGRKFDEIFWTSGIYKIVPYPWGNQLKYYRAYYKPEGLVNWGNFVEGDKRYKTFRDAVKACENHQTKGGGI